MQKSKHGFLNLVLITLAVENTVTATGTNELGTYDEAIRRDPNNAALYDTRGRWYGIHGEPDKAINDFNRAIQLNHKDAAAYGLRGKTYADKGDSDKALSDLTEAIRLNPTDSMVLNNRGYILSKKGYYNKALVDLNRAIHLDPKCDLAYGNRGYVHSKRGEFLEATNDFSTAITLNPNEGKYYNSLAWLLATCANGSFRNGTNAVKLAKKSCELVRWKLWYCTGTLAAAYAELGDFDKAVAYEQEALAMPGLSDDDRSEAKECLELYNQKKAYREKLRGDKDP